MTLRNDDGDDDRDGDRDGDRDDDHDDDDAGENPAAGDDENRLAAATRASDVGGRIATKQY